MKKAESEMEDDLRSEYDLESLRVRKLGSDRKSFSGSTVRLDADVAAMFPTAEAVNEALRFLIKVVQQNQPIQFTAQPNILLEQTEERV